MSDSSQNVPNPTPNPERDPKGRPNRPPNPAPTPPATPSVPPPAPPPPDSNGVAGGEDPLGSPIMLGIQSMLKELDIQRAPKEVQGFFAELMMASTIESFECALDQATSRETDDGEPRPSLADLFSTARYRTYDTVAAETWAVAVQMARDDGRPRLTAGQLARYIGEGRSMRLVSTTRRQLERRQPRAR